MHNSSRETVATVNAYPGSLSPDRQVEITYVDCRVIGNGSFGVVFQATLTSPTHEQVAIKKVLQDKRFKNRELQIMRRLDHCNVVKLKYFFHTYADRGGGGSSAVSSHDPTSSAAPSGRRLTSEVYLNLVLEYIPETLYKMARNHSRLRQPLPLLLVKLYMYQLFRSLNYIHSMDICHRDIKPQNLLLNPDTGVLKLCDFGSAKSLIRGEPNVAYICSRYYRAPELIFGSVDYTTKIDIWSAGCVMAELILGEPMFPGESSVDQLVEIIKVLGTPSREQLREMNQHYTEFRFPAIRPCPWSRLFARRAPGDAAELVAKLLEYAPSARLTPLQACAHRFFDELRGPDRPTLPNGRELPPLFNFTDEELSKEPDLANVLIPPDFVRVGTNSSASVTTTGSASTNSSASSAGNSGQQQSPLNPPPIPTPSGGNGGNVGGVSSSVPHTAQHLHTQQQHVQQQHVHAQHHVGSLPTGSSVQQASSESQRATSPPDHHHQLNIKSNMSKSSERTTTTSESSNNRHTRSEHHHHLPPPPYSSTTSDNHTTTASSVPAATVDNPNATTRSGQSSPNSKSCNKNQQRSTTARCDVGAEIGGSNASGEDGSGINDTSDITQQSQQHDDNSPTEPHRTNATNTINKR